MIKANIVRSLIATVSLFSLISCAPLQEKVTSANNKAVPAAANLPTYKDEGYYQEAVRAIIGGDYASALDYLQAARQTQANDVRVLNAFGVIYDKLGRFDLSARYYAQALAVNPASPIVAKNLAYSGVLQNLASSHPEMAANAAPPTVVQMASSVPPLGSIHDTGAPANVVQLKVADASAPTSAAPIAPTATQAPSNVSTSGTIQDKSYSAQLEQVKIADARDHMMAASGVAAAIQVTSDAPPSDMIRDMGTPAQITHVKVANAKPAATTASVPPTTVRAASNVPPPSMTRAMSASGRLTRTAMTHVIVPAMMGSHSPVEIRTALRSRPVDLPRSVPLLEPSDQAGKTRLVAQIPTPEAAPPQRARGLTGHPLAVANATGRSEMAEPVRRQLVQLGWSAPHSAATEMPNQQYTTIRYAGPDALVAQALARTLPFPVHLATCTDRCSGIVLTMGNDYLGWKPFFTRLLRWKL